MSLIVKEEMPMRILPSEIRFESIKPGVLYAMSFSVVNATKTAQRVRIQAPRSPCLALNYIPAGALAPGLDLRAEIEVQLPETLALGSGSGVVSESITVSVGPHQMQLPIFASRPSAAVLFPGTLNLGLVAEGQVVTHELCFENAGLLDAAVEILRAEADETQQNPNREDPVLSITPNVFTLKAKSTAVNNNNNNNNNLKNNTLNKNMNISNKIKVEIKFQGIEIGNFRETFRVKVSGYPEPLKLDVSAQTVLQRLTLLQSNGNGLIDNIEFGTIFYGQSKSIPAVLVNNGPQQVNYFVTYMSEDDDKMAGGHNPDEQQTPQERNMILNPSEGIIQPFSQIPVTIRFFPEISMPSKGFYKKHLSESHEPKFMSSRASIECAENGRGVTFNMQGTAVMPSYSITPTVLRFDNCAVYDRRDILVTIQNKSTISLTFDFTKAAHFKMDPIKGSLPPNDTTTVVASFTPSQLGHFANKILMSVCNGLRSTELHLIGTADDPGKIKKLTGGPKKLVEEFTTQYKFVETIKQQQLQQQQLQLQQHTLINSNSNNSIENSNTSNGNIYGEISTLNPGGGSLSVGTFARMAPWDSKEYLSTNSWDEFINTTGGGKGLSGEDPTFSFQELRRRAEHKQKYNDFLQQSYKTRNDLQKTIEHNALIARNGPDRNNPNGIDMGMARGLDEPILKIPKGGDPLWLANATQDGDGFLVPGGRNRIPLDESRLIQKKYHDAPRTQAEIRDCSVELTYEDLKLVISSHKILNFGRVCINSVTAKNFAITNDLQQCVLIKLETNSFEPELRQSRPAAQVVPGGAAAGFDIYFQCHDLGKYKKTFTWSINGNYTYKVGVVAEVVPIELKLDKIKLVMEFPEESLEKSIAEDVVLNNPGNAIAEFLWGANGAFQCYPERGVIDPGQSAIIKVVWTPKQGKSNEDELGLHISGGLDQTLKVIGVLKESKADFDTKKLSMGTVAVGMEVKLITNLKNTSANPAVFHFDTVDEKYGLIISPNSGRILPGESSSIIITISPKAPMSYENVTISADIRGGKSVTLKLSGESKIPELSLLEKTFDFGLVVVGSDYRVPMTLINKSSISACLILDVSEYPEFTPTLGDDVELHLNGLLQKDKFGNILEPYLLTHSKHISTTTDSLDGIHNNNNNNLKSTSNVWKLTLAAGQTFAGALIFTPVIPQIHNFQLQLYMQGLHNQDEIQFNCLVTAEGLGSRLNLSTMIVDFGDRVVSRDPSACMTYYKEFTLQNVDILKGLSFTIKDKPEPPRPITNSNINNNNLNNNSNTSSTSSLSKVNINNKSKPNTANTPTPPGTGKNKNDKELEQQQQAISELNNSPPVFVIFPTENSLPSGASTPMRVTFLPQNNGEYIKKLYIYISDQPDTSRPYLTLLCRGSGVFPRLSFDRPMVSLPPVPLGITTRTTFTILNNGYDNLMLQYRQSPTIPIPLEVTFPDGQELGLTALKVRVNVACKSELPISWAGKLEFYDNDGERFSIDLSGVSDCSLFTCYSFCRGYSDLFGFVGIEDQPIRYMTKKEIMSVRLLDAKHREQNRRALVLERQKQKGGITSPTDNNNKDNKDNKDKDTPSNTANNTSKKHTKGKKHDDDQGNSAISQLETKISHDTEPLIDGVILAREAEHELVSISDLEITILLKWLNKFVCRKMFDIDNFLNNILETNGEIVIDCIEQMSGRKIPFGTENNNNVINNNNNNNNNTNNNTNNNNILNENNTTNTRPDTAVHTSNVYRLINKYKALLNYLVKVGALLNNINPFSLLDLQSYMLAHENELRRIEGERLTPAFLQERRHFYENKWNQLCKEGWAEILFQCIKIFILGKLSYTEFAKMPGVVVNQDFEMEQSIKQGGKSKKSRSKYPPEFLSSNVHTHGEAVLLAWAGYHIHHAKTLEDEGSSSTASSGVRMLAAGTGRRVIDIDSELNDFYGFCQLVHSHMPESTRPGGVLSGYTVGDHTRQTNNLTRFQAGLQAAHLFFDFTMEEIATGRGLLMALLNLFFGLPCMIPKANIEFKGILGTPIVKVIELKNPSKKRVVYQVTLEGSKDYTIESNGVDNKTNVQVMVPPESSIDFPVTLTSKFSELVTARIVFWGLRDGGVAGSTMVFKLNSNIYARKPKEIFKKSMGVYDLETIHIDIKNPYDKECSFDMKLHLTHLPSSIQDLLDTLRGLEIKNNNNKNKNKEMEAIMNSKLAKRVKDGDEDKDKNESDEMSAEIEILFKQPFWCSESIIFLPAKGSKVITINILPFMLGTYTCELVLIEPKTGEFSYEIHAEAGFPKPMDKIDLNVMQMKGGGISPEQVLKLASKNLAFEKAVHVVTEGRISVPARRAKAKAFLLNMISTPIVNDETGESPFIIEMVSPYFVCKKEIAFVSDYGIVNGAPIPGIKHSSLSNKYRKVHKTLLETPTNNADVQNLLGTLNTVLFHVKCEQAGVYKTRSIVYAKDNHLDIRVLDLSAKVSIARQEMNFYFKGAARQKVTQEISIQNISTKDWILGATISGIGFSGPKSISIPKNDSGIFILTYCPPYAGNFNGTLTLRNTEADDNFEYKLFGTSEDPLAEDHLHLKCNARSKKIFTIPLQSLPRPSLKEIEIMLQKGLVKERNKDRPINSNSQYFEVQTDLPYLSGSPYIEVTNTGISNYEFSILSPVGGIMSGSITFIDPESGIMMWYIVDIEVAPPAAESTIKVEAMVRKAVVVEIILDNPTIESQNFTVKYRGDGLFGDNTFILPPSTNPIVVPYELIYSPLHTGIFNGSISFINDHIGEIWYKLLLTASPAPSTEVELIECMVGTTKLQNIPIENPLPESITLSVHISDIDHFSVVPEAIQLGPYSQSSFSVMYRPSSLSETVTSIITLSHPKFGEILYNVSGRGQLPGLMPSTTVLAPLGTAGSHTITFRNPFPYPLPVDILLSSPNEILNDVNTVDIVNTDTTAEIIKNSHNNNNNNNNNNNENDNKLTNNIFSLLLRKPTGVVIAAKSTLQLGISFTPDRLGDYYSFLQVRSSVNNRSLLWCFPIVGTAEAGTPQRLEDLITPCKSSLIQDINIYLEGLKKEDLLPNEKLTLDMFTIITKVQNPNQHSIVSRALRLQPIELIEVTESQKQNALSNNQIINYDYIMRYRLLFEPLKTFNASTELVITCKNKGRWRADIDLQSTEPDVDDVIELTAPVSGTDRVGFKLNNRFLGFSSFDAYFTAKSSKHFTVTPTSGVLAPYGAEGTSFVISFSPTEYGSRERARLMITTDDVEWSYEVIGNYPEFNIHNMSISSKVDCGLSKSITHSVRS